MVGEHIQTANGPTGPPGVRLSFQAIGVILTIVGLLLGAGIKVVAMDRGPIVKAIDTNSANIRKLNADVEAIRARQEEVNRQMLQGISRIEGKLENQN